MYFISEDGKVIMSRKLRGIQLHKTYFYENRKWNYLSQMTSNKLFDLVTTKWTQISRRQAMTIIQGGEINKYQEMMA